MPLLKIQVRQLSSVLGIYGQSKNFFPARAALLHPHAASAYAAFETAIGSIRVSDMFRTVEESMKARAEKAGVQPPGFSAHNFGLAVDVDVDDMLRRFRCTKPELDAKMAQYDWYCHRKDGNRGMEDWHYNYLGPSPEKWLASASKTSTAGAVEAKIVDLYAEGLSLDPSEAQEALKKMRMYSGDIDGEIGPRSRQAIAAFQRAWKLPATGELDARTERTLAVVTAEIEILP